VSATQRHFVSAVLVLFGIAERLSGIANMLVMERDWVPAVAESGSTTRPGAYTLTTLNATMRRIDLICKLFAPLVISAIIEGFSAPTSVLLIALGNVLGVVIEPQLALIVWSRNKKLQALKAVHVSSTSPRPTTSWSSWMRIDKHIFGLLKLQQRQIRAYFNTKAWMPSLSLALLYLSALSYAATFITWLLASGFSLLDITIARTAGSVVEVSSTFITPYTINRLARTRDARDVDDVTRNATDREGLLTGGESGEKEHVTGLARSGLWSVFLQLTCLVSGACHAAVYISKRREVHNH